MSTYTYHPIGADLADELRARDDAGRACEPFVDDEGGAPLRCCFSRSVPGEKIVLVSYAPLRRWAAARDVDPGAYDEVGPVFLHAQACAGPAAGFPVAVAAGSRVYRAYGADGHILGGRRVYAGAEGAEAAAEVALDELFADPATVLVHLRAVEFGCFFGEVHRS
jgi:hypothetical protein